MKKVGRLLRENLEIHITQGIEKRKNIFLVNYSKISGPQMNNLRKDLKKVGAEIFASKNNIAQRALKQLKRDELASRIKGQIAFIWSDADTAEFSKTLTKFTKELEGVCLK